MKLGLGVISIGVIGYFFNQKLKQNKAYYHPARELGEIALKMDQRISSFCGKKYTIKTFQIVRR